MSGGLWSSRPPDLGIPAPAGDSPVVSPESTPEPPPPSPEPLSSEPELEPAPATPPSVEPIPPAPVTTVIARVPVLAPPPSPPAPATVTTAAPTYPPPTAPTRQRKAPPMIVIVLAIVALVAVAVAIAIGVSHDSGNASPAAATGATIPSSATATTTSAAGQSANSSSQVSMSASVPSSASPPLSASVSPGGIDLSAVLGNPAITAVAATLDTYFAGINSHNPQGALSVFVPTASLNPNDPAQVAQFGQNTSTTIDDMIVIGSIAADPQSPGGVLVDVKFRSQQQSAYGPDGQTCTRWTLTYEMQANGSGYQILKTLGTTSAAC